MLSDTGYFAFSNIEYVITLLTFIPLFTAHISSQTYYWFTIDKPCVNAQDTILTKVLSAPRPV